jgi:TetR/AcrR family transcriptional repressor of nem operon
MGRPTMFDSDAAVDAAMTVFWSGGYAGTTPQRLLNELGIGKGSFYNTFESKHSLFIATLELYKDKRIVFLKELLGPAGPMRDRIDLAIREVTGLDSHRRGCLMVNTVGELGQGDPQANAMAADLFEGMTDALRTAVASGQRTGEFSQEHDAGDRAASLVAMIIGVGILLRVGSGHDDVERIVRAAVDDL